jgi:hypothetical protein
MTHSRLSGLVLIALALSAPAFTAPTAPAKVLCQGFLPENDMQIPVRVMQEGGLSRADFDSVLDKVEAFYGPVIAAKGAHFVINRNWNDGTVNASAQQMGGEWIINMYGGLARHPVMNKDGFTLVACHETGHHLGGAPKTEGWFGDNWASNEGEADYYATLRCMRNIFTDEDNAKFVQENEIDPVLKNKCEELYSTQAEENLCMREGMAGMVGARLFQSMGKQATAPKFDTPDPRQVGQTDDDHPATQCRLDTYYAGTICVHDRSVELSDTDPNVGTCSEANGQHDGVRPRCWFAP